MKAAIVIGVTLATLAFLTGTVQAGGTPPTLTWETGVSASPIGCVSDHDSVFSLTTDASANIYVYCGASGGTQAIIKYTPAGLKSWQVQVLTPTPTLGIGIAADSAGHIALAYCDGTASNKVFKILSQSDGATLFSFAGTGVFTTSQCNAGGLFGLPRMVDTLTLNETSIQYLVGDSSLQYSFVCHWNLEDTPCAKQFEVFSLDRGPLSLSSGGPYIQAFVSHDPSISGGGDKIWRTNLATGAEQTGATFGDPNCLNGIPWYDINAGASIYHLHTKGCTLLTTNRPTYTKLSTADFSTTVSEQTLTEPIPVLDGVTIDQWINKHATMYLDGENRGYYCGRAISSTNEDYTSIVKHNLDTNAQVWNITTNDMDPDGVGSEFVNACVIDKDGALIVLRGECTSSTSSGCTFSLRKYEGAGAPRTPQTGIIPATGGDSDTPPFVDQVKTFVDNAWGFDTGWIWGIVVVAIVVGKIKGNILITAVAVILGVFAAVKLGWFPDWLLLLMAFIAVGFVVAVVMAARANASGDGGE